MPAAPATSSPSCCSTSTTSRRSTTRWATGWATTCCGRSPSAWPAPSARRTWSRGSAVMSSASWCPAWPGRATPWGWAGGGGSRFLVSCMASGDDGVVLGERLLAVLREPFFVDGVRLQTQASIGIAVWPDHGGGVETLVQGADVALYTAKEQRGCWSTYSPESDRHTPERLAMLGELRTGLETGQLVVFYQPKSDAKTGVVVGVEALARWEHPTRGLLPPDEFIPLAENTGLIGDLTFEVLRQALAQVRAWHRRGMDIGVSVNLSVRQLTDMNLPRDVAALLADFHLPASVLTLEVTES